MSEIQIKRKSKNADIVRDYKIYLDRRKVLSIGDGELKCIDVSPGKHLIYAKIDFCRSKIIEFEIADNEVMKFEIESNNNMHTLFPIFFLAYGSSMLFVRMFFESLDGLAFVIYMFLSALLVIVFWLLAYRKKKYIMLKKID